MCFDAFVPVFCVLTMEIFLGVIPSVTNEGFRVHGAANEEFVCEVVDELADWDYLKVSMKFGYRSAPGKIPDNAEEF